MYIEIPENRFHQCLTEEDLITSVAATTITSTTIFEVNENVFVVIRRFLRERRGEEVRRGR